MTRYVKPIVKHHLWSNPYSEAFHHPYSRQNQAYSKGRDQYDETWSGSKDSTCFTIRNGIHSQGPFSDGGEGIIKDLLLELLRISCWLLLRTSYLNCSTTQMTSFNLETISSKAFMWSDPSSESFRSTSFSVDSLKVDHLSLLLSRGRLSLNS